MSDLDLDIQIAEQEALAKAKAGSGAMQSPGSAYLDELTSGAGALDDVTGAVKGAGQALWAESQKPLARIPGIGLPMQIGVDLGTGLVESLMAETKKPAREIINDTGRTSASVIPAGGVGYDWANVGLGNKPLDTAEQGREMGKQHRRELLATMVGLGVPFAGKFIGGKGNAVLGSTERTMATFGAKPADLNPWGTKVVQGSLDELSTKYPDVADKILSPLTIKGSATNAVTELESAGEALGKFYDKYGDIPISAEEVAKSPAIKELMDIVTDPMSGGVEKRAAKAALNDLPDAINPLIEGAPGATVKGLHGAMTKLDDLVSKSVYEKNAPQDIQASAAATHQVVTGYRQALYDKIDRLFNEGVEAGDGIIEMIHPKDHADFVRNRGVYSNLSPIKKILTDQASKSTGRLPIIDWRIPLNSGLPMGVGAGLAVSSGGVPALLGAGTIAGLGSNAGRSMFYNMDKLGQAITPQAALGTGMLSGAIAANPPKLGRTPDAISQWTQGDLIQFASALPPGENEQVTKQLVDAYQTGDKQLLSDTVSSVLAAFPEARSQVVPGSTIAQSEMGGLVADPQERAIMKRRVASEVRNANSTGRKLSIADRAQFASDLNSNTPFKRVPEEVQARTVVTSPIDAALLGVSSGGSDPNY